MELMLFRHGIAEASGPDGTDASRRLTAEGNQKTAEAARGLARVAVKPQAILTSPLMRAAQTAAILAPGFDCEPETLDALGYGDAHEIIAQLARRREQCLLLVGHEPTLSQTAELLCTGRASRFLVLKKAGCICLEARFGRTPGRPGGPGGADSAGALMQWVAAPRMLRALGAAG